jgi:hypothetical protein
MTALIDPQRLRQMAAAGDTAMPTVRRDTLLMQWKIDPWTGRAVSGWVVAEGEAACSTVRPGRNSVVSD